MMKTIWVSRTTYTLQFFCNHNLFQIFAILSYLELGIFAIPSVLEEFPNEETISAFGIDEIEDGFHLYDDMILDDVQDRLFRNVDSELDRQAIRGNRVPGGIIPYKFDETTTNPASEARKLEIKDFAEKFSKQMKGCLTIR